MWLRAFALGFLGCGSTVLAFKTVGGYSLHRVEGPSMRPTFKTVGGYSLHRVEGPSMRPTFNPEGGAFWRDIVLVKKIGGSKGLEAAVNNLDLGSVVCVEHPRKPGHLLIKRLAAKSGGGDDEGAEQKRPLLPANHVWIESDAGSKKYLDSWVIGPIPFANVTGLVTHVIYPPHRIQKVEVVAK